MKIKVNINELLDFIAQEDSKIKKANEQNKNYDDSAIRHMVQMVIDSKNSVYAWRLGELNNQLNFLTFNELKNLSENVITYGDSRANYNFALRIHGADKIGHGEMLVKSKDEKYNALFSQNVKGIDVTKNIVALLNSGNIEYYYIAAQSDCDKYFDFLQQMVFESNDIKYLIKFAANVEKCDVGEFQRRVLEVGNSKDWLEFASLVEKAEITPIALKMIKAGNINDFVSLLKLNKPLDKMAIVKEAIKSADAKFCYYAAIMLKLDSTSVIELEKVVAVSGCSEILLKFAENVELCDINMIQQKLIEKRDYCALIEFTKKVKGVNLSEIEDAFYNSKSTSICIKLFDEIKGINVSKFKDLFMNSSVIDKKMYTKFTRKCVNKDSLFYKDLVLNGTEEDCDFNK